MRAAATCKVDLHGARFGGLLFCMVWLALSCQAQEVTRGRSLYVEHCARCHADPPGSGFVDPRVRSADEILAAIQRVSPMGFLSGTIGAAEARDLAAYFSDVLGPQTFRPDFNVGDFWWDQNAGGQSLNLRQFSARNQLAGIWYTFDASGSPVWFLFNGGSWSAPSVYTAPLVRANGTPYLASYSAVATRSTQVGTIALVFSDRDNVDLTITLDGQRVLSKMVRFPFPR